MKWCKMRIFISFLAFIVLCGASLPSFAAENQDPPLPAPLQNMAAQGAQIRYMGRDLGMDGWVVIKDAQEQYFYATPDGQAVLLGILFNNKGDAITLQQINALRKKEGPAIDKLAGFPEPQKKEDIAVAPPSSAVDFSDPQALMKSVTKSKSEQLYEAVSLANTVQIGSAEAPVIYTFIDPECPHCHDLINEIRKSGYLEQGLVQLKLIPVGVLSEKSLTEAAYLLASPTPQKDLFDHLDGKGNALLVDPNANTQGVQRNMKLMQDWKLDVTPFSVYKDKLGKIKILQGRPKDLKSLVIDLR